MAYSYSQLNYSEIGMLAPITRAYLDGDERVNAFTQVSQKIAGISEVIANRKKMNPVNRDLLVRSLKQQYGTLLQPKSRVAQNIESVQKNNTYTVTTGHQLNLFTGPAYFFYKIMSTIRACEELSKIHSEYQFVPVYWMATEDHDFEEIKHTYFQGAKLTFESALSGMVGEFATTGIEKVILELSDQLGDSIAVQELISLFEKAYVEHTNLADATRYLVDAVFGKYGVVVVDGNDAQLKCAFAPVVKQELLSQTCFKEVSDTLKNFDGYKAQVSPRDINLFYVSSGLRSRITQTDEGYAVVDTDISFTEKELLEELERYPERFSPNALMRPVYQETVLPNVMYYGGGAEVAYWLELKSTFEAFGISYPVLAIRNAFLLLDANTQKRMYKLGLDIKDLFVSREALDRKVLAPSYAIGQQLQVALHAMNSAIDAVDLVEKIPLGLEHSAEIAQTKIAKALNQLEKKAFSAHKKQHADTLAMLTDVLNEIYLGGTFQERKVNGFDLMLQLGPQWVDEMLAITDPFCGRLTVVNV